MSSDTAASNQEQPRVAIIVLNWHDRQRTEACLQSLRELAYDAIDIVLIDNGCEDFEHDAAQGRLGDDRIHYLRSRDNLGYAGGCNLGIGWALERDPAFIWCLNNDATPEPGALTELVAAFQESPNAWALGPKILRTDQPERLDSIAVAIDLASGRFQLVGHGEEDRGQFDSRFRVDAVTGCAILIRSDALRVLGGFDERYFLYLEDLDLCLRIAAQGGQVGVAPQARVHHDRAPSGAGRQSPSSLYYTTRNHYLLMATHGGPGALRHALRTGLIAAANLAFALRADPAAIPRRVLAVLAGSRDYFARRFGER